MRFPLCDTTLYDVVFNEIAEGVIAGAAVPCDFVIPDPPPGETIDLDTVVVSYTPGGGGDPVEMTQVATANNCMPNAFYIEGDNIHLCPETCTIVAADDDAKIKILFGCELGGPN